MELSGVALSFVCEALPDQTEVLKSLRALQHEGVERMRPSTGADNGRAPVSPWGSSPMSAYTFYPLLAAVRSELLKCFPIRCDAAYQAGKLPTQTCDV